MNSHVRDCLVEGYEHLIETLNLPDENDRHILATAIHTKANLILTFNLKDFPREILEEYRIEAETPDKFILELLEEDSEKVCLATERQRLSLKNPPKSKEEFLETLRQQNLEKTSELLEKML